LILEGDSVEVMRGMEENSADALVCDPPYGLSFMGKEFDKLGESKAQQLWHEAWAREAFRVLKPGGHMLAFGGTRTYHRLVCAVEDAGFEIRDTVQWIYGSGFNKAGPNGFKKKVAEIGGTEAAEYWSGFSTQLKPAHEPIVLARKPLSESSVARNVLEWGTGGINVDGSRVGTSENLNGGAYAKNGKERHDGAENWRYKRDGGAGEYEQPAGRFPANLLLSHASGCGGECVEGCPVRIMDEQSGQSKSTGGRRGGKLGGNGKYGAFENMQRANAGGLGDSGGASRFFQTFSSAEPGFLYQAKASRAERQAGVDNNPHPTVKPLMLMRYLVKLITPPGGTVLDPFAGSGSTGCAAVLEGFSFVGIEQSPEYAEIARRRIAHWQAEASELPELATLF
jgi:DNA modification methylase